MKKPRQTSGWSPEEDNQLRAMLEGGKSLMAIAARHRRTVRAIRGRAVHLGLSVAKTLIVRARRNAVKSVRRIE
jgi:hypothetical protein